ncbi:unnamed protein product [Cyprideis torosa]|uniref:Uncharacterized protein n=1 Tax=Cyprideis torosa TaxID=163714 RepID=A0A7R8WKY1_9CRUS|nr:unnamed protein product [Cyprideis torosa]CAG0903724.1 unnamed protein product [Cyprideis torosa]
MTTPAAFLFCFVLIYLVADSMCYLNPCSAGKMWDNYNKMKAADCINCDKYFHCQGNYEAVHDCGGWLQRQTAEAISDLREWYQGSETADSAADQAANLFGRNGGDCASEYLRKANCAWNPKTGKCAW